MGDRERREQQFDRERGRYDYRDESYYRGQNQARSSRYGEERESYPRYSQDESRRYARNTGSSSYEDPYSERERDFELGYPSYTPERDRSYGRSTLRGAYGLGYNEGGYGRNEGSTYGRNEAGYGRNEGSTYGQGSTYGRGEGLYGRNWGDYREREEYRGHEQRGRNEDSWGQQLRDAGQQIARKVKRAFRGPKGYKRSDERIREDVNDRLAQQDDFDPSEIEVSVSNSEVTLTGTVQSRHEKFLAEEIADDVSGVTEVHNQVRVRREQSTSSTTATAGTQVGGTEAARNRNARA